MRNVPCIKELTLTTAALWTYISITIKMDMWNRISQLSNIRLIKTCLIIDFIEC